MFAPLEARVYLPEHFRIDDRASLLAHAAANPFATVLTQGQDGMVVSHLPLLVDAERGLLRGHLARENPQFVHLEAGAEALAIFHGPHAYISPSVYAKHPSVPTWNYVVVHARGHARVVDEQALAAMLDDLVTRFDPTGWRFEPPDDYRRKMMGAIAGFEIPIEALEGKAKLSQNKSAEDRARVAGWLEHGGESSRALAVLMRARQ